MLQRSPPVIESFGPHVESGQQSKALEGVIAAHLQAQSAHIK